MVEEAHSLRIQWEAWIRMGAKDGMQQQPSDAVSVPRILYRYVTLERAKQILRENKIYFSSPSAFNDPFDCKVVPSFNAQKRDFKAFASRMAAREKPGLSRPERRRMVRSVKDKLNTAYFNNIYRIWEERHLNNSGILCLSEKSDDILMWSHYAAGHSGVCLESNVERGDKLLEFAQPVTYAAEYPDFDITKAFAVEERRADALVKFARTIFLTKSNHWEYEREWRVIDFPTVPEVRLHGSRQLPRQALAGLILGCQMAKEGKLEIRKLAKCWSQRPVVYVASRKDRQFALDITACRD
jgi:hypothetical protein